jgi:hypothetical protein
MFRYPLNHINYCPPLSFSPDQFEGKVEEAADILRANAEFLQSLHVALIEQFADAREVIFEPGSGVIPFFDVALGHPLDNFRKSLGDVKTRRRDGGNTLADDVLHDIKSRISVKGRMSTEHRVEEYTEAVDVGSCIRLSRHATSLFGRYEGQL